MVGKIIGDKYVLLKRIGQGGNGSIYLARDLRLGKYWAVKVLEISVLLGDGEIISMEPWYFSCGVGPAML